MVVVDYRDSRRESNEFRGKSRVCLSEVGYLDRDNCVCYPCWFGGDNDDTCCGMVRWSTLIKYSGTDVSGGLIAAISVDGEVGYGGMNVVEYIRIRKCFSWRGSWFRRWY